MYVVYVHVRICIICLERAMYTHIQITTYIQYNYTCMCNMYTNG